MNAHKYVFILFAFILTLAGSLRSFSAEELIPAGMINFRGVPVPNVLKVYKDLTGAKLFIDSRAKNSTTQIVCKNEKAFSKADAAKMIEKALLEQASVVITKLDSNRVSVAYNDSLPVTRDGKKEEN